MPAEILWRRKVQFYQGSGIAERMGGILRGCIADVEPAAPARNSEEQVYLDIFVRQFSNPHLLTSHVWRWADESGRL